MQFLFLQAAVEEIGDDAEDFLLVPVDSAVGCILDQVSFRRDIFLPEGLEEQVGLGGGDDGVRCAVHEEHGSAGRADIGNGIGCIGLFGVGIDAAVSAAENGGAVDPEGFRGAGASGCV